jgi:hypothetical protein
MSPDHFHSLGQRKIIDAIAGVERLMTQAKSTRELEIVAAD